MATDVDDYLAGLPDDARAALQSLRQTSWAAAPDATEVISYRIPTFRHNGPLVAYAAFKDHCSFYAMSRAVMDAHKDELDTYETSKGTIHFSPNEPLPDALVTRLVKARLQENEARRAR